MNDIIKKVAAIFGADPQTLGSQIQNLVMNIGIALLILVVAYIVAAWVKGLVSRMLANKDQALRDFIGSIARYTVIGAGFIAAIGQLGIETTSVMAVFASAGLAVGLALQGSLSNFAAGVMILFFRPFELGDVITVDGTTGAVTKIDIFNTILVNPSNHKFIVPNSTAIGGIIQNYTALDTRRTTVDFGVAYGADIQKVCEIAKRAANSCPAVLSEPGPAVAFVEMAASSLNFQVHSWSKTEDWLDCMHQVRTAVYDALNEEGIEIPFDQVVMHKAEA